MIGKPIYGMQPSELARRLNVSLQVVCGWRDRGRVPAERVLAVEEATGVPRHRIRPDIYPRGK